MMCTSESDNSNVFSVASSACTFESSSSRMREEDLSSARAKLEALSSCCHHHGEKRCCWLTDSEMFSACCRLVQTSHLLLKDEIVVLDPMAISAASARVQYLVQKRRQSVEAVRGGVSSSSTEYERINLAREFNAARKDASPHMLRRCLGLSRRRQCRDDGGEESEDDDEQDEIGWSRMLVPVCGPHADVLSGEQEAERDHWSMLVIVQATGGECYALHYDSMSPMNTRAALNVLGVLVSAEVLPLRYSLHDDAAGANTRLFQVTAWPRQTDSSSCGAYALLAAALHVDFGCRNQTTSSSRGRSRNIMLAPALPFERRGVRLSGAKRSRPLASSCGAHLYDGVLDCESIPVIPTFLEDTLFLATDTFKLINDSTQITSFSDQDDDDDDDERRPTVFDLARAHACIEQEVIRGSLNTSLAQEHWEGFSLYIDDDDDGDDGDDGGGGGLEVLHTDAQCYLVRRLSRV